MSTHNNNPQLPPTTSIELDHSFRARTENWFEYPIVAHPHYTDYAGIIWHGNYLRWLEEARIEYLQAIGINYNDLLELGCELPVVEVHLRYHQSLRMGEEAVVKTRMTDVDGVRIYWDYQIESVTSSRLYLSGRVTLVAIDREKGKIMRSLPPVLKNALVKL